MANKKRLIDAKAGKKVFSAIAKPAEYKGVLHMVVPISEIDKLPTIDAVEVVRCRDCKHRGTDYCIFHIKGEPADEELLGKLDNDFCSYGERKDNV